MHLIDPKTHVADGLTLRSLRLLAKLTQEQMAHRLGLTSSHYARLERGQHHVKTALLLAARSVARDFASNGGRDLRSP